MTHKHQVSRAVLPCCCCKAENMGASYSFVACVVLGAAGVSSGTSTVLTSWIDHRPYLDRLKILGGVSALAVLLFFFFYKSCRYSLDVCGLLRYAGPGTYILGCICGLLLGFGFGGIISTVRRGSAVDSGMNDIQHPSANYNPLQMQLNNGPSMTMV